MRKSFVLTLFLLSLINSFIQGQTVIKMKKIAKLFIVPCKVNGLILDFIFDTGASDVSISLTDARFMFKNGYLKSEDIIGKASYQLANGEITEGTKIILREIQIENLILKDVEASIVHELDAPLLLGQSALSKLGKIEINYTDNSLVINSLSSKPELPFIKNNIYIQYEAYKTSNNVLGLQKLTGELNKTGNNLYNQGSFLEAFYHFAACLDIHNILISNSLKSPLETQVDYNNQLFILASAGVKANKFKESKIYIDKLIAVNYKDAGIYEYQYEILMNAGDKKGAELALLEGRKKMPDDKGLMYKELNHFIKEERLDDLATSLKTAIQNEPNNAKLYTTLANVYDKIYQQSIISLENINGTYTLMASINNNDYFKNAENYFSKAAILNKNNSDGFYGLGAFYYNIAARMMVILNNHANDYSTEGIKKYEAIKNEVFAMFDKCLPSFKKAESMNANDRNTLMALSQIYERKNDMMMSSIFKKRLEILDSGGINRKSYF